MINLVVLGKPGAGKGSVASVFKESSNVIHISTGDIFRKEIREKSELGILADSYISKGSLVPDEVTNAIIKGVLEKNTGASYLFDGYPRTVNQAEFLKKTLKELDMTLDGVFDLEIEDSLVIERLSSRRVCSKCGEIYNTRNHLPKIPNVCDTCGGKVIQRDDDTPSAISNRLEVYKFKTQPLIDYYKKEGILYSVNGAKDAVDLYHDILKYIKK